MDSLEVAVIPVLLGGVLPLLSQPAKLAKLKLVNHRIYREDGYRVTQVCVGVIPLEEGAKEDAPAPKKVPPTYSGEVVMPEHLE